MSPGSKKKTSLPNYKPISTVKFDLPTITSENEQTMNLKSMKKEDLYAENMHFKKQVNDYKDSNTRLKTRIRQMENKLEAQYR